MGTCYIGLLPFLYITNYVSSYVGADSGYEVGYDVDLGDRTFSGDFQNSTEKTRYYDYAAYPDGSYNYDYSGELAAISVNLSRRGRGDDSLGRVVEYFH